MNPAQNPFRIFISYSTKNKEKSDAVKTALEKVGYEISIDSELFLLGERFEDEINKAITNSDTTLLLISEDSLTSPWVAMESTSAIIKKAIDERHFFAAFLDKGFMAKDFVLNIIKQKVIPQLNELEELRKEYTEMDIPTDDLSPQIHELTRLKNNLPQIVTHLRGRKAVDISGEADQFNEQLRELTKQLGRTLSKNKPTTNLQQTPSSPPLTNEELEKLPLDLRVNAFAAQLQAATANNDTKSKNAIQHAMLNLLYTKDIATSFLHFMHEELTQLEIDKVRGAISNSDYQRHEKAILVGALILRAGRRRSFDKRVIELLKDFVLYGQDGIWQRALTGLVLGLQRNDQKVNDPQLWENLRELQGIPRVQEGLYHLFIVLSENGSSNLDKLNVLFAKFRQEQYAKEEFWQQPQHWFLTFEPNHPVVEKLLQQSAHNIGQAYIENMLNSVTVSDGQKYTIILKTEELSEFQVNNILEIFSNEQKNLSQLTQEYHSSAVLHSVFRLYLLDLWQFYYLFPETDLENIVGKNIQLQNSIAWQNLSDTQTKQKANSIIWLRKGDVYEEQNNYQEAINAYNKAIEFKPDLYEVWDKVGLAYTSLNEHTKALDAYETSIRIAPRYANAFYNKACAHSLMKEKVLSLENLKQAIALDSECKSEARSDNDFETLWRDDDFLRLTEG